MIKSCRTLLVAALFASVAPLAFADDGDDSEPLARDLSRPAVGEWIGHVSWNAPIVTYAWRIDPDGAFSSGRVGRGYGGGGAWGTNGAHLTLKYSDGLRYEGEVRGDWYSGTAYSLHGRAVGGFSMSREMKNSYAPDGDGD